MLRAQRNMLPIAMPWAAGPEEEAAGSPRKCSPPPRSRWSLQELGWSKACLPAGGWLLLTVMGTHDAITPTHCSMQTRLPGLPLVRYWAGQGAQPLRASVFLSLSGNGVWLRQSCSEKSNDVLSDKATLEMGKCSKEFELSSVALCLTFPTSTTPSPKQWWTLSGQVQQWNTTQNEQALKWGMPGLQSYSQHILALSS